MCMRIELGKCQQREHAVPNYKFTTSAFAGGHNLISLSAAFFLSAARSQKKWNNIVSMVFLSLSRLAVR